MDFLVDKNLMKKNLAPKRKSLTDLKSKKLLTLTDENEKCPICLVIPIDNKSFANKCFHSFCKVCILEWSKMKMECPLCRQPYSAVIYDIQSEYDFKEFKLEDAIKSKWASSHAALTNSPFFSRIFNFDIRSPYYDSASLASQLSNRVLEVGTLEHRRYIYSSDLYVLPGGNGITTRRRKSDAQFYRQNPACTHRLLPFLDLELRAIVHNLNERTILLQLILKSLSTISINSSRFQQLISQYTLHRTIHFIHEFYNFAISIYNTDQYYHRAIYVPRNQTTIVQIRYDHEDLFDLSDPYNYRLSRGIYNEINNSSLNSSSTANLATNLSTSRPSNYSVNPIRQNLEQTNNKSSNDSDSDVIFDGIHAATSRTRNKNKQKSTATIDATVSVTIEDSDNPTPGPSGLQNNQINLTLNQIRTQYTDDSDSDYDDDTYFSNSKNSHLPFFESEAVENRSNQSKQLKRDLEDTDDNSIEYVGYVKPRNLRTPEIIELISDDDDEEKETEQTDLNSMTKKLKTEHKYESNVNESIEVSRCRCKVKCKENKCKRASV